MQRSDINQLLEKFSFIPKICALRFCDETNFDDFVQEGIISILKLDYTEPDLVQRVVTTCLKAQQDYYEKYYKDYYDIFQNPLLEKKGLHNSLFGESYKVGYITESSKTDYYETKEIVTSLIENCSSNIKPILYSLYRI